MTYARVITPVSTFYPPNSRQQDDLTISGILSFINSSMKCKLQYFKTSNRTFVFSTWNHILFIVSGVEESVSYLRFRLQMIREIAVFLFGPDFDQIMRNNTINVNYIDLFAKYVDTFLEMSESDYKFQLGIICHDTNFTDYSRYLSENIPASLFPHDLPFVDCLVFRNHKIISRFNLTNPINYLSIFLLSVFAKIEYPYINELPRNTMNRQQINKKTTPNQKNMAKEDSKSIVSSNNNNNNNDDDLNINNDSKQQLDLSGSSNCSNNDKSVNKNQDSTNSISNNNDDAGHDDDSNIDIYNDDYSSDEKMQYFDPNYANITEPASVQLRAGYLTINGISQPISISSTRLSPNSPYVALFLTQELNASVKRFIVSGIISLISSAMSEAVRIPHSPLSFSSLGLVYYLATCRKSGETFEYETSSDVKSRGITKRLFGTMKNRTLEALFNGQTTLIWKDSHFLFAYSIFYVKSDGKCIAPSEKFKVPIFKDDTNVTYTSICSELFHKKKKVTPFEVYSIFLSVVPPQVAYEESVKILISILKAKKISFGGNINSFQASVMPSSKKS